MKLVTFGEGPSAFVLQAKAIYLIIKHEHIPMTCKPECPFLTDISYKYPEFRSTILTSIPLEECIEAWYDGLDS